VRGLALAQRVREKRLEELGANPVDPLDDQKARVRAEALRKKVEDLGREKARLEYRLEQSAGEEESLISCEEEMAMLAEEVEALTRRVRAYDLAVRWWWGRSGRTCRRGWERWSPP